MKKGKTPLLASSTKREAKAMIAFVIVAQLFLGQMVAAQLRGLVLNHTQMTDAGLAELAQLKSLSSLYLFDTKVTDRGIEELAGLNKLAFLNLGATRATGASLNKLSSLANLSGLDLSFTPVTDDGLKEVAKLSNLTFLYLTHTGVSDRGLKELAALKSLNSLDLVGTRVTDPGVNRLQKLLPKCNITRKSSDEVGGRIEAWPTRRIGFQPVRTVDLILASDGQAGSLSYGQKNHPRRVGGAGDREGHGHGGHAHGFPGWEEPGGVAGSLTALASGWTQRAEKASSGSPSPYPPGQAGLFSASPDSA